ncbi:MAG: DUF58 domain-containing protein, partial [Planctomycetes bacterium]|nr:DUF58 domain-containing protein [Planctomycetota bacterium]
SLIDPLTLMKLKSLELRARHVVEGFMAGLNRSPYHGCSVEFTEYRQYTQGDDLRYLDWRLFARTDRYYIKKFEDETNLRCLFVLDDSRSMNFGSVGYTKADYARTLVATLSYFLFQQRDGVGLAKFSTGINEFIPCLYRLGHLRRILVSLEQTSDGADTDVSKSIDDVTGRLNRKGIVVLISDLLAPLDQLEQSLATLVACGQEVLVFQILDPEEQTFQFAVPELFEALESGEQIYVDPDAVRNDYLERFHRHMSSVDEILRRLGCKCHRITTTQPLETTLPEVVHLRMQLRGRSRSRMVRRGR